MSLTRTTSADNVSIVGDEFFKMTPIELMFHCEDNISNLVQMGEDEILAADARSAVLREIHLARSGCNSFKRAIRQNVDDKEFAIARFNLIFTVIRIHRIDGCVSDFIKKSRRERAVEPL